MSNPRAPSDPLASSAVGTATNDLIVECPSTISPEHPTHPATRTALALAMSGGGFRAALAAAGVLRFLADAGLLEHVRYSSSVSGGSITNGMLACRWDALADASFSPQSVDEQIVLPLLESVRKNSMTMALLRNIWRIIGPTTRTDLLADQLDTRYLGGMLLAAMPANCRFVINAANITTGVRFGFERNRLGDWVIGNVPTTSTNLRVAEAVAASAAVPGAFAAMKLSGIDFPCANGRTTRLLDGGAYDNMGLEAVDDLNDVCLIAVNAGGVFRTRGFGKVPIIRDLARSNSVLYRQSVALRVRWMIDRFKAWEDARKHGRRPPKWARQGVLFSLASTIDSDVDWSSPWPELPPWSRETLDEWRFKVATTKTSFGRFKGDIARDLVYRGWWLAGATLTKFHPGLVPTIPSWNELS